MGANGNLKKENNSFVEAGFAMLNSNSQCHKQDDDEFRKQISKNEYGLRK